MKRIICLVIVFVSMMSIVFAMPYNNRTSFCVGTNYGANGINTTSDATNADSYYQQMGLSTHYVLTAPTIVLMQGSYPTGVHYLENGIVFLSGHGSPTTMYFNYMGNGGNYAVGVRMASFNMTLDSYYYIGLGQYALNNVALYVLAGCETAKGASNIAKYVVDQGAKISIGWTTKTNSGSHSSWLNRFNNKIKDNTTSVLSAAQYANSFIYLFNNVKNYKCYGDYNSNPKGYMDGTVSVQVPVEEYGYCLIDEATSKDNSFEIIQKWLLSQGVELSDYIVEVNGSEEQYIDYVFYEKDVRTELGFSFLVLDNALYFKDNTCGIIKETRNRINELLEDGKILKQFLSKDYLNEVDPKSIEEENLFLFYSSQKDSIYAIHSYIESNGHGEKYGIENYYLLEGNE